MTPSKTTVNRVGNQSGVKAVSQKPIEYIDISMKVIYTCEVYAMSFQLFKNKLSAASYVRKTRLIIGLDLTVDMASVPRNKINETKDELERRALEIIHATSDYCVAFKFNRHIVLPLGLFDRIPTLLDAINDEGLVAIMDCKINDIGDTNEWIARYYFDAGFDAIIVNPFVGWTGGLDTVFKVARNRHKGLITLCYMSHPASNEGYGLEIMVDKKNHEPIYHEFAKRALKWDVDGVIVGATYPERIREIRRLVGEDIPILSPGIGAQGGDVHQALTAGASYIIVARSIVNDQDPASAARRFAELTQSI